MELLYTYLTSDYLVNKTGAETTVIDEDSFIDTNSVKITVHDKVSNHTNNKDTNQNNDVYNVDLSFTMIHEPNLSKDNLRSEFRVIAYAAERRG